MKDSLTRIQIYSTSHHYLGEAFFRGDQFKQLLLNEEGSAVLEPLVLQWQLKGVPFQRMTNVSRAYPVFVTKSISFSSPFCACSFTQWLKHHGFTTLKVAEPYSAIWDALQQLPFTVAERMRCLTHLQALSLSDAAQWQSVLSNLVEYVMFDSDASNKAESLLKRSGSSASSKKHSKIEQKKTANKFASRSLSASKKVFKTKKTKSGASAFVRSRKKR